MSEKNKKRVQGLSKAATNTLCEKCLRECKQSAAVAVVECRRFRKRREYKQMVLFK